VFALSICFTPSLAHFFWASIEDGFHVPFAHYTKRWQDEVNVSLSAVMSSFLIMGRNKQLAIDDKTIGAIGDGAVRKFITFRFSPITLFFL